MRYPEVAVCSEIIHEHQPVVGVVYNPIRDIMYEAIAGQGAFKNGKRINCTTVQTSKTVTPETSKLYLIMFFPAGEEKFKKEQ